MKKIQGTVARLLQSGGNRLLPFGNTLGDKAEISIFGGPADQHTGGMQTAERKSWRQRFVAKPHQPLQTNQLLLPEEVTPAA